MAAYRLLSARTDLPLHLGVTEAGTLFSGLVKSALGIGMLLAEGIGDTLRVSLTRDPVEEVRAGFEILRALGIRQRGPEIIACPTCGRTRIDLFRIVEQAEQALRDRPPRSASPSWAASSTAREKHARPTSGLPAGMGSASCSGRDGW